jgi:ParB family transcriptional regulator, chromosome partitioning protein
MSRLDRFKEIGTSLTNTSSIADSQEERLRQRETITSLQIEIDRLQQEQPTTHLSPLSIRPSPYQPRKYFDPDRQAELNANVREFGIFQNLVVRQVEDGYELIAGERRLIASLANNLTEVPVVILSLADRDVRKLALAENLHRENLNPIEETQAILDLLTIELDVATVDEVKSILYALDNLAKGKKATHNAMGNVSNFQEIVTQVITDNAKGMNWRSFVNNRLPLLNLPDDILNAILKGSIEYTKGQAIARIDDLEHRAELLAMAIEQRWSLTQIKQQIKSSQVSPAPQVLEPKQRIQSTLKKATTTKVWTDPQKWEKLEKLLAQIDDLLG